MSCVILTAVAVPVSAAEPLENSSPLIENHVHLNDSNEDEYISTYAACNHNGTLKGTTYVGTCSKCGGFLYYVYCKACGKYTGATICLCR